MDWGVLRGADPMHGPASEGEPVRMPNGRHARTDGGPPGVPARVPRRSEFRRRPEDLSPEGMDANPTEADCQRTAAPSEALRRGERTASFDGRRGLCR
jgi:hypothetical protein